MALFNRNRFRALASAFMLSAVLTGCGSSGGAPAPNPTFTSGTQSQAQITNLLSAGGGNDAVDIAGDTVSDIDSDMAGVQPGLAFEGFLDGLGGDDEVRLVGGGRVASIAFSTATPTSGELHLQRYEIITIIGGMVDGTIDASAATANPSPTEDITGVSGARVTGVTFNLIAGTAGSGDITGSPQNDVFIIAGDVTDADGDTAGVQAALAINGLVQGGGGTDEVRLVAGGRTAEVGFRSAVVEQLNLRNVEVITIDGGAVISNVDVINALASITFNLRSGTINSNMEPFSGVGGTNFDDTFNLRGTITINGLISARDGADIFNLESGTITGDVNGGAGVDSFVIGAGITIGGTIDGGGVEADTLSLATGFTPTAANLFGGVLTLTLAGGSSLELTLANIATENINVGTLTLTTMMLPAPGDGMMPVVPSRTTLMGTSGANTPALDSSFNSGDSDYNYDALGGDDVITISAPVDGNVLGGAGMDTITLSSGGMVGGNLEGGAEADTFMLTGGTVGGDVLGGAGADVFTLSGGTVGGNLEGGAEADTFMLTGGTVTGNIDGGADNDTVTVTGGVTFGGTIDGGAGTGDRFVWGAGLTGGDVTVTSTAFTLAGTDHDDTVNGNQLVPDPTGFEVFVLDGGTIGSYLGFAFVDRLELLSGSVTGTIVTGGGNDELRVTGGVTFGVSSAIDGGNGVDRFVWGAGLTTTGVTNAVGPTFTLAGINPGTDETHDGTNTVPNPSTFEVFVLDGGTIGGYTGWEFVDMLELLSGSVTGNIAMGDGDDQLTVTGGVTFGGTINGGDGDMDRFVWGEGLTTPSVSLGFVLTGTDHDGNGNEVPDPTGFEVFVLDGGTIGAYAGTDNADMLELRSGTVTGAGTLAGTINMADGDDQLTVTGGVTFTNASIDGGAGTGDRFVWGEGLSTASASVVGTAFTLAGTDHDGSGNEVPDPTGFEVFVLDGGTIGSYTDSGGGGDDNANRLELLSGMVTFNILLISGNDTFTISGGTVGGRVDGGGNNDTFNLQGGAITGNVTGSGGNDVFTWSGGTVGGYIDGGGGTDTFTATAAVNVRGTTDDTDATANTIRLRNVETITLSGEADTLALLSGSVGDINAGNGNDTFNLEGGTITGNVDGGAGVDTFNLQGGTITGNVLGGGGADVFNLFSAIAIGGFLDGGADTDVLNYAGAMGTDFTARGGLADDADIRDDGTAVGSEDVRNIESQVDVPAITSLGAGGAPAGLRGAFGFEVLDLSPALNLYGAMSDALMQFGQQTAQGFALADLNLATGRATSLVSKDSPFTKGRIWAHKITHSGNGKGSIGLGLTGLTARADSDYDYEMSLTQHGFDAPLAATRLGAFNLRAVSHTMTGVIETNVAEANVSGYGAGVALLWNSGAVARQRAKRARAPIISAVSASAHHHHHGLSAHITSLAGAYEVEAHTSPLNPRAVVSEVSEGSFSAINAVVSAGVADKREIAYGLSLRTSADITWQTLSLDDFTETGSGGSAAHGIIINFDKATRFTARVGAGLEAEHWFSDVVFVHETSSGGTLSSGLRQDYKQDDGTAIEMKFGGKLADLATGLTLKAYAGLRTSLTRSDSIDPSAHLALNWRF